MEILSDILVTNDMYEVIEAISTAKKKWYEIGTQLGVSKTELERIKSKYPQSELAIPHTFHDVIAKWLISGSARWSTLIEALRFPTVGMTQLADQLAIKYTSPFPAKTTSSKFT